MGKKANDGRLSTIGFLDIYLCICKEANTFLNMFEASIIRHHLYII